MGDAVGWPLIKRATSLPTRAGESQTRDSRQREGPMTVASLTHSHLHSVTPLFSSQFSRWRRIKRRLLPIHGVHRHWV